MDFIEGEAGIETRRKFDLDFDFEEVYCWLKALRLFKPGALRAGGNWNLAIRAHNNQFIAYDNRFISVVTIEDRKIVHCPDYMVSQPSTGAGKSE